MKSLCTAAFVLAPVVGILAAPPTIQRLSMDSEGKKRTYYLFVPDTSGPAPLIVLLHGSGRDGLTLAEPWKKLAAKDGIVLVAPDALSRAGWAIPEDGPYFLYELVEVLKNQYDIDPRRVYLFGHSAGAIQALEVSLLESGYFAAVAVHAGVLPPEGYTLPPSASRKIPMAIWVGTNDSLFPLARVRTTRDRLKEADIPVQLTEINGHTHNYYSRATEINDQVWAFLKQHRLEKDPYYTPVRFLPAPGASGDSQIFSFRHGWSRSRALGSGGVCQRLVQVRPRLVHVPAARRELAVVTLDVRQRPEPVMLDLEQPVGIIAKCGAFPVGGRHRWSPVVRRVLVARRFNY